MSLRIAGWLTLSILGLGGPAFSLTLPKLGLHYLDHITGDAGGPWYVDSWPGEALPSFDPFHDRDDLLQRDGWEIDVRPIRPEGRGDDLHVRYVTLPDNPSGPRFLALYRSGARIELWGFNPHENSFRALDRESDSPSSNSRTELQEAWRLRDGSVRMSFLTRNPLGHGRGHVHQFLLVFKPEAGTYRLSFIQERLDFVYDGEKGSIEGTAELRVERGGRVLLERRTLSTSPAARGGCDPGGTAQRLGRTDARLKGMEKALDCLAGRGQLLSRRTEAEPSQLLDLGPD